MKTQIIVAVMECVASILGMIVTAYVIPFLRSKLNESIEKINESKRLQRQIEMKDLKDFIEDAVEWANQTIPKEEWERRKVEVFNKSLNYMNTHTGLDLTNRDIDTIIEAFVIRCKKGK